MTNYKKTQITKILKNSNYSDFLDFVKKDKLTQDELQELIYTYSEEKEIMYYTTAMEYLKDNDSSLMESLEIAHGLGYTANKLNSELLATLLLQDKTKTDLTQLLIK